MQLLEMMEEEKLPWFHIFAQVDYRGLFPALPPVCLLRSNLCRHTHTQTHKLAQALVHGMQSCSLRLALFLAAAYLILCSLLASRFSSVL